MWKWRTSNCARGGGLVDHHEMIGHVVPDQRIETERHVRTGDQVGGRLRIAAGEQRDVVALPDKFLRQVGYDTFRPAIKLRWDAFGEGSDLCNFHGSIGTTPELSVRCTQSTLGNEVLRFTAHGFGKRSLPADQGVPRRPGI